MKIMPANRIAPDGTPRFAASHLGLFCLPMSHKKDARLIWVKPIPPNEVRSGPSRSHNNVQKQKVLPMIQKDGTIWIRLVQRHLPQ